MRCSQVAFLGPRARRRREGVATSRLERDGNGRGGANGGGGGELPKPRGAAVRGILRHG
jgi:hypothetical protein